MIVALLDWSKTHKVTDLNKYIKISDHQQLHNPKRFHQSLSHKCSVMLQMTKHSLLIKSQECTFTGLENGSFDIQPSNSVFESTTDLNAKCMISRSV